MSVVAPHSSGLVLRNGHRRPVIGMLFGHQVLGIGMIHGFISSLTRGMLAAAHDRNCHLLLPCGMSLLDRQAGRPAWPVPGPDVDFVPVGPWNTDGLIAVHSLLASERIEYVRELKKSGFPIVYVGTAEGGPAIGLDNTGGVREALTHLVEHGHRHIAYIGGWDDEDESGDSGQRLRAFRAVSEELGLSTDPRLIGYGKHQYMYAQQTMRKILTSGAPFTAVLASNDESALGAIRVLTEAGLQIPRDVAVVGFDDRSDSASSLPPLTTVHHPVFERGYQAVGLLLDRIEGRMTSDDAIINVPTRLVVRRSCGCKLKESSAKIKKSTSLNDASAAEDRLTQVIARAILSETQQFNAGEVHQLSRLLAEAFLTSLRRGEAVDFLSTLKAVLGRMEQTGDDASVWMLAIRALEEWPDRIVFANGVNPHPHTCLLMQKMLTEAGSVISEGVRQQQWSNRETLSEETGLLTTRLLATSDETEILRILAEHLPGLGISNVAFVLFEPEDDDPVAWSVMRTSTDPEGAAVRFRSRDFPPPEFSFGSETAHRLALVPLLIQQGVPGYVVFEARNLKLCAGLTRAINTALRSAKMYREAIEGRRLAEEANAMKSRFLSTVSHELRTPLSLVLTASELLLAEKEKGKFASADLRNLARIRAGAQHLDGLIRDVLDLAVDELGQLRLTYESLDMAPVLEPIAVVGEQLARAKGLGWHVHIAPDLPKVWADRARLRQVVLNLIANAVKFTARGDVVLRVESVGRTITITVEDTGVGIPLQDQDIIFSEFRQSQHTSGRGYGGLGLGLAICKRLVEMHAGKIRVCSSGAEGVGTTFMVTLPALDVGLEAVEKSLEPGQTVWLLDDQFGSTEPLYARLMCDGFDVRKIYVGDIAPLLSTPVTDAPEAVMIGTHVGADHGWQLMQQLKDCAATRDILVLFYSLADEQNASLLFKPDYLTKPIGTAEMASALRRQGWIDDSTKTILIVDDDTELLTMHAEVVQTQSPTYRVLQAANGADALTQAQQEQPDLILLDLMMPEMSGFDVLEALQKNDVTRHIPVIVLTAQTLTTPEMARLDRGVATVLAKGVFTVEETLAQIKQTLVSNRQQFGEAQAFVRSAMAYIHEHYQEPLGRAQIARYLRISENHLTRCFRQVLHMPPMTYLSRYRINRAKALLNGGDMTVINVANAVGFPNEFYFSYVFRRETGTTPSAYRRGQR